MELDMYLLKASAGFSVDELTRINNFIVDDIFSGQIFNQDKKLHEMIFGSSENLINPLKNKKPVIKIKNKIYNPEEIIKIVKKEKFFDNNGNIDYVKIIKMFVKNEFTELDIDKLEIHYETQFNFNHFTVFKEIFYWRKANMIHKWFVDNVQGGVDDCNIYPVEKNKILELLDIIDEVLKTCSVEIAEKLLPTAEGFFWGSTEYDEDYFDKLKRTKRDLEPIIKNFDFEKYNLYYLSSW